VLLNKGDLPMMNCYIYGKNPIDVSIFANSFGMMMGAKDENATLGNTVFLLTADGTAFLDYEGQPVLMWNYDAIVKYLGLGLIDDISSVFSPFSEMEAVNEEGRHVLVQPELNMVVGSVPFDEYLKDAGEASGNLLRCKDMFTHVIVVYRRSYDVYARSESGQMEMVARCKPWNNDCDDEFARFSKEMYERFAKVTDLDDLVIEVADN
jgi:hypothetical protein